MFEGRLADVGGWVFASRIEEVCPVEQDQDQGEARRERSRGSVDKMLIKL